MSEEDQADRQNGGRPSSIQPELRSLPDKTAIGLVVIPIAYCSASFLWVVWYYLLGDTGLPTGYEYFYAQGWLFTAIVVSVPIVSFVAVARFVRRPRWMNETVAQAVIAGTGLAVLLLGLCGTYLGLVE